MKTNSQFGNLSRTSSPRVPIRSAILQFALYALHLDRIGTNRHQLGVIGTSFLTVSALDLGLGTLDGFRLTVSNAI